VQLPGQKGRPGEDDARADVVVERLLRGRRRRRCCSRGRRLSGRRRGRGVESGCGPGGGRCAS
jgi:hypothetical protein